MTQVLTLKRDKYIRASELENLNSYEGRTFILRKNNTITPVKLSKVKRSKVYLEYTEGRTDSFSIPFQKFLDYYELPMKN